MRCGSEVTFFSLEYCYANRLRFTKFQFRGGGGAVYDVQDVLKLRIRAYAHQLENRWKIGKNSCTCACRG